MRVANLLSNLKPEAMPIEHWPFHYESLVIEQGRRPIGFRFSKHIVNIGARLNGHEIVATGEADTLELAQAKAYSELLERSALIGLLDQHKCLTSNGWAAHPMRAQAQIYSTFELIERDAVLSQWYSSTPFIHLPTAQLPTMIQNWAITELAQSEFPTLTILLSTKGLGPSVSCLFTNEKGFGVSAHATRATLGDSIQSAIIEACRAAHIVIRREHWKDSVKLKMNEARGIGPGAHGVYYAYHAAFPNWMVGDQLDWPTADSVWNQRIQAVTDYKHQFQFHQILKFPMSVGYTTHPNAFDLTWGSTNSAEVLLSAGARRLDLTLNSLNKKPHIVS